MAGFVAAEHEQVSDAQKTQVDQRILCFGLGVAAADYVRNGRNAVALLEGGGHSHSARTRTFAYALIQAVGR